MIDASQCRQQLATLLRQQIDYSSKTNDYLVSLKNAIAENRLNDLGQALTEPQDAFKASEELEQQRRKLMQSYGFAVDREGLEHCISWCDDDAGTLNQLHSQLLEILAELERSLQISNLLINKGKQRVERALDILTWQPAGTKTYTADGSTESSSISKRSLATA